MTHTARLPFFTLAQASLQAMIKLSGTVKNGALGARLVELINLRVSQINGCGVCIDMHWRDLIRQQADPRHLNALPGWREAPFFSERERAALHWAEMVNAIPFKEPNDGDFARLQAHFSDNEIAELGYAIAVIKGWNVMNISLRNQIPETPAPGF
ncbi:MAG: carboxymuconolactone decarboxylase family protein [Pseudomonadota bacterium]